MIPEETYIQLNPQPPLTGSDAVDFVVEKETRYFPDIEAQRKVVADLTPSAEELAYLAEKYPAPDSWWEEEK